MQSVWKTNRRTYRVRILERLVSDNERRAGIEWLARYGGNDAKCSDTEGPFIYMGSRRAFDGGMKERDGERERKRKRQGGRTGGCSKAATRSRSASVLFLPCLVHPSNFAIPSQQGDKEVEELSFSLFHGLSRANSFFWKNIFAKKLFPDTNC